MSFLLFAIFWQLFSRPCLDSNLGRHGFLISCLILSRFFGFCFFIYQVYAFREMLILQVGIFSSAYKFRLADSQPAC